MDTKLEPVLIVQKLMDLETVSNPKQVVYVGPTQKTIFRYAASSVSDSNIIFNNITAPSLTTVMRRTLKVNLSARVTVVSIAEGAANFSNGYFMNAVSAITQGAANQIPALTAGVKVPWDAGAGKTGVCLRACPLASVISSADVRINGGSTNAALDEYNLIRPFLASKEDVRKFASDFPFQPDNGAVLENVSITSPFNDCQGSFESSRGGFVATLVSLAQAGANTPITAVYDLAWCESLIISPFETGKDQDQVGLVNVNNLTISLRLNPLVNMLSALPSAVAGAPTLSVTFTGATQQPELVVEFDSQNSILAQRSPQTAIYDYEQIQTYQTVVTPGTSTLASLRLPCLPKKIYLFVAPTYSARTPFVADHFMRIRNVSVNFNDKSALLSTMPEAALYEMSAANSSGGYPTFSQYRFGCGSIVIIDCQKDLSVAESSQAGSQSQFSTLQISLTADISNFNYLGGGLAANANAAPASYTAYQVIVSPGLLYLAASEAQFVVEGASPAETLAITAQGDRLDESVIDATGAGFGSILASAWKHRSAIYDVGKKIAGGDVSAGSMGGSMGGMVSAGRLHRRA